MDKDRKTKIALSLFTLISIALISDSAIAQDQPVIARDSIQVTAYTINVYKKNYDNWSWAPKLEFKINGPIESGSQLYADFTLPGSGEWVKFDCQTQETPKGRWRKTACGGNDIPEDKGSLYTGPLSFTIHMRNELAGTDSTLFTGKLKVAKVHSNEAGPKAVNKFVYFVQQDWNLPIGYVLYKPDDVSSWKRPTFEIAFWARGEATNFQPHLFYQGKEVGKMMYQGEEVGRASCEAEIENQTTHYVEDSVPQKAKWSRVICEFPTVKGWDKTGEGPGMFGPLYVLAKNPGSYEFKVLWNNHLARSIKFEVGPDGKLLSSGAENVGSDRVIVPVQILGDQDGQWDKTAWKTDAFYGNPLTGFSALP